MNHKFNPLKYKIFFFFFSHQFDVADVDPEAIRAALRDYVQNLINIERERDDALSEVTQLKRNLNELQDSHGRTEQRMLQIQKTLTEAEEG